MNTYKEERRYLFGCAGKVQHKNYIAAEYCLTTENLNDSNCEIYQCDFCGFFHIGTLFENKGKIKLKVEKSKFQSKRQRKELTRNKKKIRRKGR